MRQRFSRKMSALNVLPESASAVSRFLARKQLQHTWLDSLATILYSNCFLLLQIPEVQAYALSFTFTLAPVLVSKSFENQVGVMASSSSVNQPRTEYYLFGYPISHSASPAFHNTIFDELKLQNRYQLHDTVDPRTSEMLSLIRSPSFGGAAVTMPIKVTVTAYLDRLEPQAKEIGSCNTIIVEKGTDGSTILVGQNYDWEGVHNALLHALPEKQQTLDKPFGVGKCGFIIGGGGTTRAAVYALRRLNLSPIYLINRDLEETRQIIEHFPQHDLRPLKDVSQWTNEQMQNVACGVGAIPSFEPVTPEEKNVYDLARKVFTSKQVQENPLYFLEMAYKPRRTIMFGIAESAGWTVIEGIEAMIEQGLAQQRAWLLRSASSPFGGKREALGEAVEARARELVRSMEDITVPAVAIKP